MNAQQVWQEQSIDAPRISLAYVRHGASTLERRMRWRNALEYVGCFICCALFGFKAWHVFSARPLMAAAAVCFGLCTLYGIYRRHQYAAAEPSPADAGVLDTLNYQRRQFERLRDWQRRGWRYVSLVVLPACALMLASAYFELDPVPWKRMGFVVLMLFVAIGQAVWRSKSGVRRLQREIDALDSLAVDL
jgi:uncharacterized membrane protein YfcA